MRRRAASRSSLVTPVTLSTCFTSARKPAWFLPGDLQQRTQQGRAGRGAGRDRGNYSVLDVGHCPCSDSRALAEQVLPAAGVGSSSHCMFSAQQTASSQLSPPTHWPLSRRRYTFSTAARMRLATSSPLQPGAGGARAAGQPG